MSGRRANYALVQLAAHLGPDEHGLDLPWAEFCGDATGEATFEVPAGDPTDAYVQIQAYEVDQYGHEILVNGESLTGFDLPPADGWQLWMDTVTGALLAEGENTIKVRRDVTTGDSFAVGTVAIHWREPAGDT